MTAAPSSFHDTAFQEPTSWPLLEPQRVPQSSDWTDARFAIRRRPAPARSERRTADPRSRVPPAALTPLARGWMQDLPLAVRPGLTAKRHPHVINRLAPAWDDDELLAACFADLLLADRIDRQGFGLDVLDELLKLQAFSEEPRRR